MKVAGKAMRTIWLEDDGVSVGIIDQTRLPHALVTTRLRTLDDAAHAIRAMLVRGAPLIGAAAAYGVALAMDADACDRALEAACRSLLATRPTAVNLRWAVEEMRRMLLPLPAAQRAATAYARAAAICEEDVAINRGIAAAGLPLIEAARAKKDGQRPRRDPDPLQRRLARDGRLGHGARADLSGA